MYVIIMLYLKTEVVLMSEYTKEQILEHIQDWGRDITRGEVTEYEAESVYSVLVDNGFDIDDDDIERPRYEKIIVDCFCQERYICLEYE